MYTKPCVEMGQWYFAREPSQGLGKLAIYEAKIDQAIPGKSLHQPSRSDPQFKPSADRSCQANRLAKSRRSFWSFLQTGFRTPGLADTTHGRFARPQICLQRER